VSERIPAAFTVAEQLRQVQSQVGMATPRSSPTGQLQRPRPTVEPAPLEEPAPAAEPSGPVGRRRWAQRIPIGPVMPAAERYLRVGGQRTPPGGPGDVPGSGSSRSGTVPPIGAILALRPPGCGA